MRKVILIETPPEIDSRLCTWDAAEHVAKSIAAHAPGTGDVIVRWATRAEIDAPPFAEACPLLIAFDIPTADPNTPRHYQVIAAHAAKELDTHAKGYEWKFDARAGTVTRVLPLPSTADGDLADEGSAVATSSASRRRTPR